MASALASAVLTCATLLAVDGDTIRCDGVLMEDVGSGEPGVSGYDAPEIERSACDRERIWGEQAKAILQEYLDAPGTVIEDLGARDSDRHALGRVRLADGTTAGEKLIALGYAVAWKPGQTYAWCHVL
jgi:micrococcal nuclease